MDTFFKSDWANLENLVKLLGPVTIHTDIASWGQPVNVTSATKTLQLVYLELAYFVVRLWVLESLYRQS